MYFNLIKINFFRCPAGVSDCTDHDNSEDYTYLNRGTIEPDESNSGSVITGLLIFFGILILIVSGIGFGYFLMKRRRSGKPFTHERLDDNNLEISNPMYMNGDIEDDGDPMDREFTLEPDTVSYFVQLGFHKCYMLTFTVKL